MISLNNVSFHYKDNEESGGISEVNLQVKRGELLIIAGESGCGKTTLSKCINGLIPYFEEGTLSGEVKVIGENTKDMKLWEISEKTASVFQDPRSQFFTTSVFDEMTFGCRNMGYPREEIMERTEEAVRNLEIEELKERELFSLSSGEKQKVAIASCYCMNPQIYLFDEPSANLDEQAIRNLADLIRKLKEQGHTIIVMEHRFYYLRDLFDRFAFMENGRMKKIYTKEEALQLSEKKLTEYGLRLFYPEHLPTPKFVKQMTGENKKIFQVKDLSFQYKKSERYILQDLDFQAAGGEIIGITGENGAGKSTFAKVMTGLLKEQQGEICWQEEKLTPQKRLKKMYYVLQDSDYQLFADSVEKELFLGNEKTPETMMKAEELLQCFGLQEYRNHHPAALSRGQKQRVTIAAALLSDAEILILDEPTSGLDGRHMRDLINLLREVSRTGKLLLIISHDMEFIRTGCDRIVELKGGKMYE